MQNSLYVPILIFSIFILILFVYILALSVAQYSTFVVTSGTVNCVKAQSKNVCNVSFDYVPDSGVPKTENRQMSFQEIGQPGRFVVDVAYRLEDNKVSQVYIIGSNYHQFLGTQNNVIIYSVLSFLALVLVCSMIPWKSKDKKKK